ncbi:MAG: FAD-dependent oxidoreductase [Chloroflexi bacterium]|nr:FAD-dependent oxidoreductase [Chloroflexota bacterium]
MRKLFEPIKIADIEVKNRIVMLAMGIGYCEQDGTITDRLIRFYVERAKGGAGLIIVPCAYNDFGMNLPMHPAMEDDKCLPGIRRLTDALHEYDVKAFAQLLHLGSSLWAMPDGSPPVSASAVRSKLTGVVPRELTIPEIRETIAHFAEGAERAKQGGFDGVEFAGTGGYLFNQFISPLTNNRDDEYGGDFERRLRFPVETVEKVRESVGPGFPISYRTCGDEFMKGGNRQGEMKFVAQAVEKAGADVINVTAGWHQSFIPLITMDVPRGTFVYLAQGTKEVVNVPVIACNRINDPFLAEQILQNGQADMIGMARALLTDPELPNKAAEGRFDEIRPCVGCNQGCLDSAFSMREISCVFNPAAGREAEFDLIRAEKSKKVFVIGGGPAGMEATRVAALRGHNVTLFEKADKLGGQLNLAAIPPGRGELANAVSYLVGAIQRAGVRVKLGKEVDIELITREKPDVVILAAGAIPIHPNIPGIEGENVVFAADVLEGKAEVGETVVIIGGGAVGIETALFVAKKGTTSAEAAVFLAVGGAMAAEAAIQLTQKGKHVTILEMLDKIGQDMGITTLSSLRLHLRQHGAEVITEAKAERITESGIEYTKDSQSIFAAADTIIIAVGSQPECELAEKLQGLVSEIHQIGDCVSARTVREAIEEAAQIGRQS